MVLVVIGPVLMAKFNYNLVLSTHTLEQNIVLYYLVHYKRAIMLLLNTKRSSIQVERRLQYYPLKTEGFHMPHSNL